MANAKRQKISVQNGGAQSNVWLHRFAVLTASVTFFLIFVGGLVKSHEAGLSVPDWPNSYGWNMFTFPIKNWVGNIFYEHTHRLLASFTGFLIVVQAIWIQRVEKRAWVKKLGWSALLGVVAQGILGGLTVIFLLPTAISSSHAGLAQTVFCITLATALVTSRSWNDNVVKRQETVGVGLRKLSVATVAMIFLQLLMGAVMRHEEAGLAIPTFPFAPNGSLIPDFTSFGVAINFAHRTGALLVFCMVLWTASVVIRKYGQIRELRRPAMLAVVLLVVQITLGIITILSEKAVTPTTLHVSGGAALLGTMVVLTIRARHLLQGKAAPDARTSRDTLDTHAPVNAETISASAGVAV